MVSSEAKIHLELADSFLAVAKTALDDGHFNVAATLAVNSAIHSKDAICLVFHKYSKRSPDHQVARRELRAIPNIGNELEMTFSRILAVKNTSEYASVIIGPSKAQDAVKRATSLVETAKGYI
jgi:uncharacterized protein (UPF0332 family)